MDISADVAKISCPTLIFCTTGSGLRKVDSYTSWQTKIANSQLSVIESDAWHAAGALPDYCATESSKFIGGQK